LLAAWQNNRKRQPNGCLAKQQRASTKWLPGNTTEGSTKWLPGKTTQGVNKMAAWQNNRGVNKMAA